MARRPYAGTADAYVIDETGRPLPGTDELGNVLVSGTAWDAPTGGAQITDLQDLGGSPIPDGIIVPDATGRIPRFLGPDPDPAASLWLDFGAGTFLLLATDLPDRLASLESGGVQAAGAQYPATAVVYSSDYRSARPVTNAGQYTWTADGTADDAEIQAAIDAVAASGGGKVLLLGGTFHLAASIQMKTLVHLQGQGPGSTRLYAAADLSAAMIVLADGLVHLTTVSDLWIDGRDRSVHGIHYTNASGEGFTHTSPDPSHTLRDLYIHAVGNATFAGHGIRLSGANNRAGKYSSMRINNASGCGIWVDGAVDSNFTDIEIGSSGSGGPTYSTSATAPVGHGFFISQGDNNVFSGCKAWYSRGAGFYLRGTRNTIVGSTAQDNYSHGFHLNYGKNSLVGCHADSNGQVQKLVGDATGRGTAGIYVSSELNNITGCQSYDRGAGQNNWTQAHGFQFTSGFSYGRVTGCITFGNLAASVTGSPGTGTTVDVRADAAAK